MAAAAAGSPEAVKGVRLILADAGLQRVKTFAQKPLSVKDVVELLYQHLGLRELCGKHGVAKAKLSAEDGSLTVTGLDAHRRVPIRNDVGLITFLSTVVNTAIPSVEVQLGRLRPQAPPEAAATPAEAKAAAAAKASAAPGGTGATCRPAGDRVEYLEDANFKLLRGIDKLGRRIDELERRLRATQDEARMNLEVTRREILASQDMAVKELHGKVHELQEKDQSILADLDVVRQHGFATEEADNAHHEEHTRVIAALSEHTDQRFEAVDGRLNALDAAAEALRAEDARQQGELDEHLAELTRLDEVKVDVDAWEKANAAFDKRVTKEMKEIHQRVTDTEASLDAKIVEAKVKQAADHKSVCEMLDEHKEHSQAERDRLEALHHEGMAAVRDELAKARQEVIDHADAKVKELLELTEARFAETKDVILQKDKAIHEKVDENRRMTEQTFEVMNERFEEFTRVARARFGTVEKDLVESMAALRTDTRAEIERHRGDFEQEAARLDADFGDLHAKYDVSKQELAFVQEKLIEQREWAQRQITETATATRAVKIDAEEGLAATTKMLHALRDDAVTFREKMAKYISLLQHSSDSQGDAISALEVHRGRLRSDVDMLIADHKAYTEDMDGWADDVRMKVERLFRAMEPAKVEWKIQRAMKKAKDMRRPLSVKSPVFSLRGLTEVQLEFFPEGTNNSPDDKAVLRVYLPPNAHVRFQAWIGFLTDGPLETKPTGSLSMDILVDDWKTQIQDDGCLPVIMQMIRDFTNNDESLSTEVRIENP
mmetsp:Transcript_22367/g.64135  ORF Transcript_22367/g.64135 Transcript_22367/m.64135 type:complete len:775 (+) Transcript_22367:94-2418(+)